MNFTFFANLTRILLTVGCQHMIRADKICLQSEAIFQKALPWACMSCDPPCDFYQEDYLRPARQQWQSVFIVSLLRIDGFCYYCDYYRLGKYCAKQKWVNEQIIQYLLSSVEQEEHFTQILRSVTKHLQSISIGLWKENKKWEYCKWLSFRVNHPFQVCNVYACSRDVSPHLFSMKVTVCGDPAYVMTKQI